MWRSLHATSARLYVTVSQSACDSKVLFCHNQSYCDPPGQTPFPWDTHYQFPIKTLLSNLGFPRSPYLHPPRQLTHNTTRRQTFSINEEEAYKKNP